MKQYRKVEDFVRPQTDEDQEYEIADSFVHVVAEGRDEPISDRSYVEIFLNGINAGAFSEADARRLITASNDDDGGTWSLNAPDSVIAHYRELLSAVVAEPSIVSPAVCETLVAKLAGKVVAVPAPRIEAGKFSMGYKVTRIAKNAVIDWATVLLLGNFIQDLCQCHLPSCKKFFLVEPVLVGRPRREYCSKEHRDDFFNKGRKERVRASRAGETQEEWAKVVARYPGIKPREWRERKRSRRHK
jgi:hypothetical protein